eukprot:6927921-Pyramimonas_sp.AAC.1
MAACLVSLTSPWHNKPMHWYAPKATSAPNRSVDIRAETNCRREQTGPTASTPARPGYSGKRTIAARRAPASSRSAP